MKRLRINDELHDPILTTRDVASMLGVSISTAQLWIESGVIASWKTPGGHRRVKRSAVTPLLGNSASVGSVTGNVGPVDSANSAEYHLVDKPAFVVGANESERLRALAASALVDTPPEQVFDRLTWLASRIVDAPMALLSLVTARRQWFKSRVGVDVSETPREWAFCGHAILSDTPLIVPDTTKDERFANNPLVTGEPFLRFYAGFTVTDKQQFKLGTLCVLDRQPKTLSNEQIAMLRELAAIASEEVARRS